MILYIIALLLLILIYFCWLLLDVVVVIHKDVQHVKITLTELKDLIRTENGRLQRELEELPSDLWKTARILGATVDD